MSPEKQRIAIAEACGWEWKKYGDTMAWYNGSMKWVRAVCGICPDIVPVDPLPDYINDINTSQDLIKHLQNLGYECTLIFRSDIGVTFKAVRDRDYHAVAVTRKKPASEIIAEVFLKTIGLWKD
jgi:hypothetical protein